MPWKNSSTIKERERFVILALQKKQPLARLCRQFGISRQLGYKWRRRFVEEGRRGLEDRRRGPTQPARPQAQQWRQKALGMRRAHRHWGGAKIRVKLAEKYGSRKLPSARSLERWFGQAGLIQKRPRRARQGPMVAHPGLTRACRRHQVWSVDFKGWYRTDDGQRQEPLTIREMWTRYVLAIRLLPDQSDAAVRAVFTRVFREHGLPEAIRVDNGAPFGGCGALGLTRLSAWWERLKIRVEFTRRARPGDNAAHEQMHGLYARVSSAARIVGVSNITSNVRTPPWDSERPRCSIVAASVPLRPHWRNWFTPRAGRCAASAPKERSNGRADCATLVALSSEKEWGSKRSAEVNGPSPWAGFCSGISMPRTPPEYGRRNGSGRQKAGPNALSTPRPAGAENTPNGPS